MTKDKQKILVKLSSNGQSNTKASNNMFSRRTITTTTNRRGRIKLQATFVALSLFLHAGLILFPLTRATVSQQATTTTSISPPATDSKPLPAQTATATAATTTTTAISSSTTPSQPSETEVSINQYATLQAARSVTSKSSTTSNDNSQPLQLNGVTEQDLEQGSQKARSLSAVTATNRSNDAIDGSTLSPAQSASNAAHPPSVSQGISPKGAPVLRPSIEEVASELSRKHLNLEHQNWRLKQSSSQAANPAPTLLVANTSAPIGQQPVLRPSTQTISAQSVVDAQQQQQQQQHHEQQATRNSMFDAEQDIRVPQPTLGADESSSRWEATAPSAMMQQQENFLRKINEGQRDHYLHIDTVPSVAQVASATGDSVTGRPTDASQQNPSTQQRKRKTLVHQQHQQQQYQQQQQGNYEGNELYQCYQYLQNHGSPLASSSLPSSPQTGSSQSADSQHRPNVASPSQSGQQQLPCSCETRTTNYRERDNNELSSLFSYQLNFSELTRGVWLSCDNVQLIGSHFYATTSTTTTTASAAATDSATAGANMSSSNSNSTRDRNDNLNFLTRFSQRDSGLQTLHSQKFHYLQLYHLKTIDLSDNRIRQIKMDAFHGLETKLEQLNLANNLLGDFRAVFDETGPKGANNNNNNNGKLTFFSDELNRLKNLRWLSLHNNQISQLAPNVFAKPTPGTRSEQQQQQQQQQVRLSDQGKSVHFQSASSSPSSSLIATGNSELVYLDLSENLLKFIPSDSIHPLNKLEILNLRKNRIVRLDELSKFPQTLKSLDLSENLIRIVHQSDLIDLPDLIELNLSHNQLSHLDKTAFLSSLSSHPVNSLSTNTNLIHQSAAAVGLSSATNGEHVQAQTQTQVSEQTAAAAASDSSPSPSSSSSSSSSSSFLLSSRPNVDEQSALFNAEPDDVMSSHHEKQTQTRSQLHNYGNTRPNAQGGADQRRPELMITPDSNQDDDKSAAKQLEQDSLKQLARTKRDIAKGAQKVAELNGDSDERQAAAAVAPTVTDQVHATGSSSSSLSNFHDNENEADLDAEESIMSSITSQFSSRQRTISIDELTSPMRQLLQFNSTLRLNLSHNFFEKVPGDSLLKFSNLRQLDMSFNRIRNLDSNYLCSIYNLVENLRILNLSGNLLSMNTDGQVVNSTSSSPAAAAAAAAATAAASSSSSQQKATGDRTRQLNRLFGCLQKLEQLVLSTNRLGVANQNKPVSVPLATAAAAASQELDDSSATGGSEPTSGEYDDDLIPSGSDEIGSSSETQNDRLIVKLGDSFGSKYLNTLDLSDNQLKSMPIIELHNVQQQQQQQPVVQVIKPGIVTNQFNQWIGPPIYLQVLNLNYNYLERLEEHEFEHLFNLQQLQLDYNKISSLPIKLMRKFTNLDRLSLDGNRISSIEPLNELLERSVRTLRVLNLANNRLLEWPKIKVPEANSNGQQRHHQRQQQLRQTIQADVSAEGEGPRLQSALVFALEELNLEGNLLTSSNVTSLFDQLAYMRSLKTLNLGYNLLNKIRSEWFKFANKNLQRLLLNGNKINNIDLGSFASNQVNELIQLRLDFNLLKELKRKTFDSLPKIRELNLANNLIHTINSESFHQINSLQILKLNNNKLTSWKCEYFSNLCNSITGNINADLATLLSYYSATTATTNGESQSQSQENHYRHSSSPNSAPVSSLIELDLSHNSLSQLRANSISVHTKLTKLNLSHNKLAFLPHDLFRASPSGSTGARQIQLVSSLKWLNLAHNRLQTIDNINFRPLKNLISFDLSFNELQTLGVDVVHLNNINLHRDTSLSSVKAQRSQDEMVTSNRRVIVDFKKANLKELLVDEEEIFGPTAAANETSMPTTTTTTTTTTSPDWQQYVSGGLGSGSKFLQSATNWPALNKLRHLNVAHNQLTVVNQSLLSELSPFALLNLNLSSNLLDSEALPYGFYTKVTAAGAAPTKQATANQMDPKQQQQQQQPTNYDLVFTLKLESLDLSYNRLSEFPAALLENHYTSMESCNISYNRIQNLIANSNMMIQIKSLDLEFNPLNRESNELILFEQKSARHLNLAATRLYAIQQATLALNQLPPGVTSSHALKYHHHRLANQTSQLDLIRSISRPIDAPYLRHLNLSSNQLVWLAANVFDKMHSLQTLDLSNNQLTRLHLLNNQLSHVSNTLEYLNLGTNLFTNLDSNDFSQLSKLQHLDLSNLLSLQKMNCKFLAKLTTLRTLRMFNYPQLRLSLNNLLMALNNPNKQSISSRLKKKIQNELIMSTIGKHCFQEEQNLASNYLDQATILVDGDTIAANAAAAAAATALNANELKWFDLEELELELFNSFSGSNLPEFQGASFKLRDELSQLLGPYTRKLTLFGLNLTNLHDDSLIGLTNDELKLKISYTSLAQLPLRQILNSLTKRTRLELDFRHNNIQSIDTKALQLLDELQLNNQVLQRNDHSSLKLGHNPFRCDCQTRPLWLWLNKRWGSIELPQGGEDQLGDTSSANNANYWLKFNSVSQTSDLKCHYPPKLRGKLTQHVYYNDLVCKGSSVTAANAQPSTQNARQSSQRKKNETRSSDSYYLPASSVSLADDPEGDSDEEDYIDLFDSKGETLVKVTKFNRYPPNLVANISSHLLSSISIPFFVEPNPSFRDLSESELNRIGKRDFNSVDSSQQSGVLMYSNGGFDQSVVITNQQQQQQAVNTKYSKHRPNIHQRHSHFSTMSALNPLSSLVGKNGQHLLATSSSGRPIGSSSASVSATTRHSLLTDLDVMILTVISIAMSVMSFVIISVCLFKYKMDRSDKQQILSTHGKLIMSHATLMNESGTKQFSNGTKHLKLIDADLSPSNQTSNANANPNSNCSNSSNGSKSKKSSNKSSSSSSSLESSSSSAKRRQQKEDQSAGNNPNIAATVGHQQTMQFASFPLPSSHLAHKHQAGIRQVLVPIGQVPLVAPVNHQNFLMRSPTIRRMHGLATNASDWFKFTIRAYPNAHCRRKHLFIPNGPNLAPPTSQANIKPQIVLPPAPQFNGGKFKLDTRHLPPAMAKGCPIHAFESVKKLREPSMRWRNSAPVIEEQCLYCAQLLAAVQQTKVQFIPNVCPTSDAPVGATKVPSSSTQPTMTSDLPSPSALGADRETATKLRTDVSANKPSSGFTAKHLQQQAPARQQREFNETDEHQQYYIPPKLIEALAKQLDQQQEERFGQQRADLTSGVYRTREHQTRAMRTFGCFSAAQPSTSLADMSKGVQPQHQEQEQQQEQHAELNNIQPQSQLPTIDVDGRFAYQTESRIESPLFSGQMRSVHPSEQHLEENEGDDGDTESRATTSGDRDDIFILVHDPSRAGSCEDIAEDDEDEDEQSRVSNDKQRATSELVAGSGHQQFEQFDGSSVAIDDECSQSSSPVTYGFMRSSPSATTVSTSTTNMTHNQYIVNNLTPENKNQLAQPHFASVNNLYRVRSAVAEYSSFNDRCSSLGKQNNNNNNNNNNSEYSVSRKQRPEEMLVDNAQNGSSSTAIQSDDQIIISRL